MIRHLYNLGSDYPDKKCLFNLYIYPLPLLLLQLYSLKKWGCFTGSICLSFVCYISAVLVSSTLYSLNCIVGPRDLITLEIGVFLQECFIGCVVFYQMVHSVWCYLVISTAAAVHCSNSWWPVLLISWIVLVELLLVEEEMPFKVFIKD